MKIIRVIVDEMPENCFECDFEAIEMCSLMYKPLDCTRYATRDDRCPLVEKDCVESFVTQIDNVIFSTEDNLESEE